MKKVLKYFGFGILLLIVFVVVVGFIVYEFLLKGVVGFVVNVLVCKMEVVLDKVVWDDICFVSWQFCMGIDYLWDKDCKVVWVKWGDMEVYLRM